MLFDLLDNLVRTTLEKQVPVLQQMVVYSLCICLYSTESQRNQLILFKCFNFCLWEFQKSLKVTILVPVAEFAVQVKTVIATFSRTATLSIEKLLCIILYSSFLEDMSSLVIICVFLSKFGLHSSFQKSSYILNSRNTFKMEMLYFTHLYSSFFFSSLLEIIIAVQ